MNIEKIYDVIVVGGGHAGTEAALAAARMGASTLLLTHSIETLGQMSCNPSIGGIGKGHLVKEIDALGGVMAHAADRAGIHFRILNASKGAAVRATRAQADRVLYKQAIRTALENQPQLTLLQQEVDDFMVENERICGVLTRIGVAIRAKAVVLAAGTFLGGQIHIGLNNYQGGRAGDPPSNRLAQRLRALPFRVARLKTGTPPRIDGSSIDYTNLIEQPGDSPVPVFSFLGNVAEHPAQRSCHIAYTNAATHAIIQANLDRSPMYSGNIAGVGPRYCPSIEDKVVRFADKTRHQIFIEPEGLTTREVYPNGISTSLPFDVQVALVRSIDGFAHAHITRPGYAIEYDFFDPRDLRPTLETSWISGLFFAGQINGTTGYEEAAAQGLLAGLNAALRAQDKEGWYPRREQAYLGVLVDDLLMQGAQEPYRMFTSRAEYRLSLREDNADIRLTEVGRALGLVDDTRWRAFATKRDAVSAETERLATLWIQPDSVAARGIGLSLQQPLHKEHTAWDLLRRPDLSYQTLMQNDGVGPGLDDKIAAQQVEIQAKYAGYVLRQDEEILRHRRNENTRIPVDFDYQQVSGLSAEAREKLQRSKPATLGMASRMQGITPATVSLLLVYLKKHRSAPVGVGSDS